jgi:PAS domain S-box-containing protein
MPVDLPLGGLALVLAVALVYRLMGISAWRRYGRLGSCGAGALLGVVGTLALLPDWIAFSSAHGDPLAASAVFEVALLPVLAALGVEIGFGLAAAGATAIVILILGQGIPWPAVSLLGAVLLGGGILARWRPAIAATWLDWPWVDWVRSIWRVSPGRSASSQANPPTAPANGLEIGFENFSRHWRPTTIGVLPGLLLLPMLVRETPIGIILLLAAVALHIPALWALRLLFKTASVAALTPEELLTRVEPGRDSARPLLARIIAELPEGIAVFDQDDRLLACNEQYRILNRTLAADLEIGVDYATLVRAEIGRRGDAADPQREAEETLERHRSLPWRLELPRPDGTWVQVLEQRVADGDTLRIMRDITATKLRELQFVDLAQRNAVLASTVASVTSGVVICDALQEDQPIVFVNAAFTRITGYSAAETMGRNCRFLQGRDTDKEGIERIRRAVATGRAATATMRNYRKDGRTFWNEINISPLRDESGRLIHFVGILQDVTNRIRTEENLREAKNLAELANRAKSEFLAAMSHDLRTPLNAIIGFSEVMQLELFGPLGATQYASYAKDIHESGRHLLEIINDILDLSKIEAGRMELTPEPVDVGEIVDAATRFVAGRAQTGGVALRSALQEGLPKLLIDRRAILRILVNLLTNAVKFTLKGGSVTISATGAESGWVALDIADTGIGIAAKNLKRVLEPFVQAEDAQSRSQQGTGLGLPIAKGLVERSGGEFKLESELGRGTTVKLRLPTTP